MRPQESARVARRIARAISNSVSPSRSAMSTDLADLIAATEGDRAAAARLSSRLPSGIPELAKVEAAFRQAGEEPPEMRHIGRGRWAGRFGGSVLVALHSAPDGTVQKVLVAGRPVQDWKEAVEAARHFKAMADDGRDEDPEDIAEAEEAVGDNVFACAECGGPVDIDADMACPKCGTEYVTCPGCDKPYPMDKNEDDHCPICGYSSWGELPEDVSAEWTKVLVDGVKEAAKTRQPVTVDYEGFQAHVEIVDRDGVPTVAFAGGDDADECPLEEFMQEPTPYLSGGLDTFLWQKNNTPMPAPKPYSGPSGG